MTEILIITQTLAPDSGIGRYSRDVVTALAKHQYRLTVLVERGSVVEHVQHNVEVRAVLYPPRSVWLFLRNVYVARLYARRASIVHALDGWPFAVYGVAGVVGTRKRLFVTALGTYSVAPLHTMFKRALLTYAYGRAVNIFCISAYTQMRLREHLSQARLTVVHLAVNPLTPLSPEQEKRLRIAYPSVASHRPVFLTVGEIKERKGQLDTLKALTLLRTEYPNFLYVLIGSTKQVAYVNLILEFVSEKKLENNVLFVSDSHDDEALTFFYQNCDLFLLNSNNDENHFEGFGLVILEAAQYGKPSIGSRGCGIEDAIQEGYSGFLTKQKSHSEIAERVSEVLSKYQAFSANARAFEKGFNWEQTVKGYIHAYNA